MHKKRLLPLLAMLAALPALAGCGDRPAAHQVIDQNAYYEVQKQALAGERVIPSAICYGEDGAALYYIANEAGELSLYQTGAGGGRLPAYVFPDMRDIQDTPAGANYVHGLASDANGGLWLGVVYGTTPHLLLQHLAADGAELARVSTAALLPETAFSAMASFAADQAGRLYLPDTANNLHVLDADGALAFSLASADPILQLAQLADGAVTALLRGPDGDYLRTVDADKRRWGERTALPFPTDRVYRCSDYTLLYTAGGALYGYDQQSNTSTRLLTWLESGIAPSSVCSLQMLADGRLRGICQEVGGAPELVTLTNSGQATRPDTTVLTLAVTSSGFFYEQTVLEFNAAHPDYQVKIINYYEESGRHDLAAARQRLNLDIIAGKGPDMFFTEGLPLRQYAAIGLLEDIYPYLDADPELSRAAIIPNILAAWDTDGKLYSVSPAFSIHTALGRADLAGIAPGMRYDDFLRLLAQHPEANKPFAYSGALGMLEWLCSVELDNYLDWQQGVCHFDSAEFIRLLELIAKLPREVEQPEVQYIGDSERLLASGEALLSPALLSQFHDLQMYTRLSQTPLIVTGLPTAHGNGQAFSPQGGVAVSSQSEHKEACWRFLRYLLSPEFQKTSSFFPTNQAAFDARLKEAMNVRYRENRPDEEEPHETIYFPDAPLDLYHLTPADAEQLLDLIETTDRLVFDDPFVMTIIREEAAVFLAGQISAEEAARRIQSRASIYVNEQK